MSRLANMTSQQASATLFRMLSALERQMQDEQNLRCRYARNKLSQNLEFARSILLRLEHESTLIRMASRKQVVQSDLQGKRERIKRLRARLDDLNLLQGEDEDDEDDSEEEKATSGPQVDSGKADSALRARKPGASADPSSLTTAREALFATSVPSVDSSTVDRETLLMANRTEQEDMTQSLLKMARDLKASSIHFSSSLDSEKDVLDRANAGLDSNVSGVEVANRRLSGLRRLSEGRGWWGRMQLYAIIAGLWLAVLVVFLWVPKLRF